MQLQYQKGPGECGSLGFEAFQGLGKGWEISTQGEHRASGARFSSSLLEFTGMGSLHCPVRNICLRIASQGSES